MIGIYKITNQINGKCYIGQSVNIKQRWKGHKKDAFWVNGPDYEYPLYRAIRKYGIENFTFEVLEECLREELNDKEIKYIASYRANNRKYGYNQDAGGHPPHSTKLTETDVKEIIYRLRNSSDTYIQIGNDFHVHNKMIWAINYGENWHFSDENYPIRKHKRIEKSQKAKLKKSNVQKPCPRCGVNINQRSSYCNKCRKQIDAAQLRCRRPAALKLAKLVVKYGFNRTGKFFNVSGRTIQKWLQDHNVPYHKKELVDWYNKQMGITPKTATKQSRIKKVMQIDPETNSVVAIFNNAKEAAASLGKQKGSHINEVCNGIHDLAYGFKWKYIV